MNRPPWEHGLSDEERVREHRVNDLVQKMINRPKPKWITLLDDHGPLDMATMSCVGCGRTIRLLMSTVRMPVCHEQRPQD